MKHAEHALQSACVRWFRMQYPQLVLFAIPNGAKLSGSPLQRAKAWKRIEQEGAIPGAADLFFAAPSGDLAGLFIEMKTAKGKQSETQRVFESRVIEAGYGYAMPRSFEEFQRVIKQYLESGKY